MTHFKSRLEFRLSIARNEPLEEVNKKWNKYMEDYDNLDNKTISDKIHLREAFYDYMNYKSKYERENKK
jgi:hypothetical protein